MPLLKNNALVVNPALVKFPNDEYKWDLFIKNLNAQEVHYVNNGVLWVVGAGDPESVVTAPVGSLYSRTDGGSGTSLYVKESGTGNTGWSSVS